MAIVSKVAVNPRWAGFKAPDYNAACRSVYEGNDSIDSALTPDVAPGDFDLRNIFLICNYDFMGLLRKACDAGHVLVHEQRPFLLTDPQFGN